MQPMYQEGQPENQAFHHQKWYLQDQSISQIYFLLLKIITQLLKTCTRLVSNHSPCYQRCQKSSTKYTANGQ